MVCGGRVGRVKCVWRGGSVPAGSTVLRDLNELWEGKYNLTLPRCRYWRLDGLGGVLNELTHST